MAKKGLEWIETRRLRTLIDEMTGRPTGELRSYAQAYDGELQGFKYQPAEASEIVEAVLDSHITLCGDNHAFGPAQRYCRELLARTATENRATVLAVECVLIHHQRHLDAFNDGKIDWHEFAGRIHYRSSWGFPDKEYRLLFERARSLGVPIVGINGPHLRASLAERDRWMGRIIASISDTYPTHRILVQVGELHIESGALPAQIRKGLADNRASALARIFQNRDELYWHLPRNLTALRFPNNTFCVFTGTPRAKLLSYLWYLQGYHLAS